MGTVEMMYTPSSGLTGAVLLLLAYSTSFIVGKTESWTLTRHRVEAERRFTPIFSHAGGLFFVDPMRDRRCLTMLDPFHAKYGKAVTTVMSVASLFLDVIWVPTTLTGLGTAGQLGFPAQFLTTSTPIICY